MRVVCFPSSETPLEKTNFSLSRGYQLAVTSGLGIGARILFSFLLYDSIECRPVQALLGHRWFNQT